jgi:thiosulfate dehydrogenase
MKHRLIIGLSALIALALVFFMVSRFRDMNPKRKTALLPAAAPKENVWIAPDTGLIPHTPEGDLIRYGRSLIANTSYYFGPTGKINHLWNGMNCQNCHLDAGTKPWGNNYAGVYSTYPKFRERRGALENVFQRVTDCIQRSLNGVPLDSNSHEMQAILAYMKWVGKAVPHGKKPTGSGIQQLPFMQRAADSAKGALVYEIKCQRCHGSGGQGMFKPDSVSYLYPPLWGKHSYTTAAGLYRLSRFAGYVKDNMPFGASHKATQVTDEEAWDLAAFVNSRPRPVKIFRKDWPDVSLKPFDHPYGPFLDSFSMRQHKYGPFGSIQKAKENLAAKRKT